MPPEQENTMPEYHELDKRTAVILERIDSLERKVDSAIDAINRNSESHWRAIARLDREVTALKVKVYGLAGAVAIVPAIIAVIKFLR